MYSFGLNISGHLGAMRCIDFVCSWLAFLWWWQHIASATPNPIAARPTFPKCLADHPTSPTTAGNVQTAIPIRKMVACVSPEDVSNTRNNSVSSTVCVSCIQVCCDVQYDFKVSENDSKSCFMGVLVGWHFSGGGSILLELHQIPLQPDQLSPKCLADHPTSPTTAGNVQTAIAIRKMDTCVSPEDVSNTRNNSVSSTVCVSCIQVFCDVQYDFNLSEMTQRAY